jgi:hypothetical protein
MDEAPCLEVGEKVHVCNRVIPAAVR